MNATLLTSGIVFLGAAIVGGGLKAFGVEVPLLRSLRRQVLLGLVGLGFLFASFRVATTPASSDPPGSPTVSPQAAVPTGSSGLEAEAAMLRKALTGIANGQCDASVFETDAEAACLMQIAVSQPSAASMGAVTAVTYVRTIRLPSGRVADDFAVAYATPGSVWRVLKGPNRKAARHQYRLHSDGKCLSALRAAIQSSAWLFTVGRYSRPSGGVSVVLIAIMRSA